MSAFANMPISRKLAAAFAAVVAVMFVSGAIIYGRLGALAEARLAHLQTDGVIATLYTILDAMLDQETGRRGYLATGDERFLESYHRGRDGFTLAFRKAKGLTSDNPVQQGRLDELNALAKEWQGIAEREIALISKPEMREDARVLAGPLAGETAMDLIRAKVAEIDAVELDRSAKRVAVQVQAYATAYTATFLGGTVSIIVAVLMGFLLTRGIAVPITRMTNAMAALAKGDTSVEVPGVGRTDEIGAMATAVQVFKDSMIERNVAQSELAHANRVATVGQLTASIAHEVNQPLAGVVSSGNACLRWLARDPPDLEAARRSIERMINDGNRAAEVIGRIRAMVTKSPPKMGPLSINDVIVDVVTLLNAEMLRNRITLRAELSDGLPRITGDRIQLQQVILNLIMNAIDAMTQTGLQRELSVTSAMDGSDAVLVAVCDSGPGLDETALERLFDAFYTTKPEGMGMGLAITRRIVEAHGGQIWATPNTPRGAKFEFRLPIDELEMS